MMFTKQKQKVTLGCDRVMKSKRFQDLSLWYRVVWLGLEFVCRRQIQIRFRFRLILFCQHTTFSNSNVGLYTKMK